MSFLRNGFCSLCFYEWTIVSCFFVCLVFCWNLKMAPYNVVTLGIWFSPGLVLFFFFFKVVVGSLFCRSAWGRKCRTSQSFPNPCFFLEHCALAFWSPPRIWLLTSIIILQKEKRRGRNPNKCYSLRSPGIHFHWWRLKQRQSASVSVLQWSKAVSSNQSTEPT